MSGPASSVLLDDPAMACGYDALFIAPHPDDVALSCGGIVLRDVAAGCRVLIVTICAGSPDPAQPLAPFAAYLHGAWHLGLDPMALRRAEDSQAIARLGADGLQLRELDAIYRDASYGERDGVFGRLKHDDPLIAASKHVLRQLCGQNPHAIIYLPLAIGQHVDHQAVWNAQPARDQAALRFYEDFPYAAVDDAVSQRLTQIAEAMQAELVPIDAFIKHKIAAIDAYTSQLAELFPHAPMAESVMAYATRIGGHAGVAERIWRPTAL